MHRLVILKTGSSLPEVIARRGDFERWIATGLGVPEDDALVVDVHRGHEPPPASEAACVVVTGSSAMVTARAPWSVRAGAWLAEVVRLDAPVLAICYGHQLLADALGGRVEDNPRGREIGTIAVTLTPQGRDDALFAQWPPTAHVQATHLQSVTELPSGAVHLAQSPLDPNQAYRIGARAWGVQFHPECDADIIRGYVQARRHAIAQEGLDPDAILDACADSAEGLVLLRRFAQLAGLR